MKKFYKIGDVSKIYNISTDILRYYEKIGLLIPDSRSSNGYRYYSEKQLWKLSNIRNLRKLEVGLKEITEYLETRSLMKTEKMIDFQLDKIDKSIRQLLSLKRELEGKKESIIFFKEFKDYGLPEIKHLDKRYVYLTEGNFREESEINLELKRLKDKAEEENDFLFTESEIGTLIKREEWEKGSYYDYSGTFIISRKETSKVLPEGLYLTYFFKGDYGDVDKHYEKLKEFMENKGYRASGDIIELYHIEIHITENKDEYVTEIQIPLEKI